MNPGRLAGGLVVAAAVLGAAAIWLPGVRELLLVSGLALLALAGGVLSWDRRGGH